MRIALFVATMSLLRVCGREDSSPPVASASAAPRNAIPTHDGGVSATAQGLHVEVVPLANGRVAAYVYDPEARPIANATVRLSVRRSDDTVEPVSAVWDPQQQAYVGSVTTLRPGSYPVSLELSTPQTQTVSVRTPPVAITATATVPRARHGGRVQIVNNHAVEYVTAPNGTVQVYWMRSDGTPVAPAEVTMPTLLVRVGENSRPVALRVEGDHYIGTLDEPFPQGHLQFEVPAVTVQGQAYAHVWTPEVVVLQAPAVAVRAGARVTVETPGVEMDEDELRHRRGIEPPEIDSDFPRRPEDMDGPRVVRSRTRRR